MDNVGYFSKSHSPSDIFPIGNFPNVQFSKRQFPKSVLAAALGPQHVLAAALGPLAHPSRSARAPIAACSASEGLTFGKVAAWEIAHLESRS